MIFLWLTFIMGGFLFGSVLFSKIIPKIAMNSDVCAVSSDSNPGAANVFMNCGVALGFLCLALDMLKGFIPVFVAVFFLNTEKLYFSAVMAAPVLGHALGVFDRMRGGKCISTSFGVLIGIMPVSRIGFLLAALYILFSTLIKLKPNRIRSIVTFALFAVGSAVILNIMGKYSVALGCAVISATAIIKHLRFFEGREAIKTKGEPDIEKSGC